MRASLRQFREQHELEVMVSPLPVLVEDLLLG